ncbi:DUF1015 domain-containing protein [bacterium]
MAEIRPFRGIRYNQKKVKVSKVVAPPYDIISPKEQSDLYKRDQFNVVRLILGKQKKGDNAKSNKYTRARDFFNEWQKKDVFAQDDLPVLYVYRQDFKVLGKNYSRFGFVSLLKLEQFFKGSVYPHERTLSKPKVDRLNLMKQTNTNFSSIFGLYDGKGTKISEVLKRVMKQKPVIDFTDWHKERNRVWIINDQRLIKIITENMKRKKVYIADGHHRYETAYNFSKETGGKIKNDIINYVMTFFCDMNDKGLAVFPTHRLVNLSGFKLENFIKSLDRFFCVSKISKKDMSKKLDTEFKKKNIAFTLFTNNKYYLLVLKNKRILEKMMTGSKAYKELDVAVLESIIFKEVLKFSQKDIAEQKYIKYVKSLKESLELVKYKKYTMAFIMNPTRVGQIRRVALNNELMPQKSTYFYPKLLTGLVMNKFK